MLHHIKNESEALNSFVVVGIFASVVEDWESCTRQCDCGAQSRSTFCNGTVESAEVVLCKNADCPGTSAFQ